VYCCREVHSQVMNRTVIKVESLGKRYRLGLADGRALRLSTMLQNVAAFQCLESKIRGAMSQ
jgi:hypothetical protein